MSLAVVAPVAALPEALIEERSLCGGYGQYHYEHCLHARLADGVLEMEPARWAAQQPALELPLDDLICVHVHRDGEVAWLEFLYQQWGGPGRCALVPRDVRAWVEALAEYGVLLRPYGLDPADLPASNPCYHGRDKLARMLGFGHLQRIVSALMP